jgi:hypothetical protein
MCITGKRLIECLLEAQNWPKSLPKITEKGMALELAAALLQKGFFHRSEKSADKKGHLIVSLPHCLSHLCVDLSKESLRRDRVLHLDVQRQHDVVQRCHCGRHPDRDRFHTTPRLAAVRQKGAVVLRCDLPALHLHLRLHPLLAFPSHVDPGIRVLGLPEVPLSPLSLSPPRLPPQVVRRVSWLRGFIQASLRLREWIPGTGLLPCGTPRGGHLICRLGSAATHRVRWLPSSTERVRGRSLLW